MEGRCFITNYTVGPSACTMVTDHCVNGTCFNTTCEPGLCGPLHEDCAEALCVPAREGGFECYPSWIGRCTADYVGYYVGAPADPPRAHTSLRDRPAHPQARALCRRIGVQLYTGSGDGGGP